MTNKILTKADLINTKFDVSEWTIEMKTRFQGKCFEEGIGWMDTGIEGVKDYNGYYFINDEYLHYSLSERDYNNSSCKQRTFSDLFAEQVADTSTEALSEELFASECHYTKCEYKHLWEAVKAFEDGDGLCYKDGDGRYQRVLQSSDALLYTKSKNLYQRLVKPWYAGVCKEKPIYGYHERHCEQLLTKFVSRYGTHYKQGYGDNYLDGVDLKGKSVIVNVDLITPLTPSQVDDIVQTMKLWEK